MINQRISVSIPEAASIAGIKKDLIYRALNSGELPSLKIGRRRLILVDSLKSWLLSREQVTQNEMGFTNCSRGGRA